MFLELQVASAICLIITAQNLLTTEMKGSLK